jgi:signal transduction histidine kinase
VNSVLDESEPLAERAQVKLAKRVESSAAITGDPQRVEQALNNFVSNGIRAHQPAPRPLAFPSRIAGQALLTRLSILVRNFPHEE